ncbi:hypothetical protein A6R68_16459, partial [Neotoma lepida]
MMVSWDLGSSVVEWLSLCYAAEQIAEAYSVATLEGDIPSEFSGFWNPLKELSDRMSGVHFPAMSDTFDHRMRWKALGAWE